MGENLHRIRFSGPEASIVRARREKQGKSYSDFVLLVCFLLFVFLVAGTGKDFGMMYQYEIAARSGKDPSLQQKSKGYTNEDETKQLEPADPSKARAFNAFIPILMFILSTIAGLYSTGEGESL